MNTDDRLRVGILSSTHGLRGEVKVFPVTDDPRRFTRLKEVILVTGKEELVLTIEGVKFFKKFVILKFKGIDRIEDIERYKGGELYISRVYAEKLKADEYFIGDLIGLAVTEDTGRELGSVKDVLQTGANDVYVIEGKDGRELLLPAIKQCVLSIDMEKRTLLVHPLDGLWEE